MFRKIIHAVSVVFFVVLILVVLYSLASRVMGETPSIFGYYFFHVSSDSMEPTLKVGDVLLVHSNKYYYQTKGDALGAPLDKVITYDQIEGKLVRKLVLIGTVYSFFCTPIGICVLIGIIVLLFGSEMVSMFVSSKKIDATDDLLFETIKKDKPENSESGTEGSEKNDVSEQSE